MHRKPHDVSEPISIARYGCQDAAKPSLNSTELRGIHCRSRFSRLKIGVPLQSTESAAQLVAGVLHTVSHDASCDPAKPMMRVSSNRKFQDLEQGNALFVVSERGSSWGNDHLAGDSDESCSEDSKMCSVTPLSENDRSTLKSLKNCLEEESRAGKAVPRQKNEPDAGTSLAQTSVDPERERWGFSSSFQSDHVSIEIIAHWLPPHAAGILSMLYGAFHVGAWNFTFPSSTEHLLWKIATITIMATPPIICCLGCLRKSQTLKRSYTKVIDCSQYLIVLPATLSRIYLLVEALISLRHGPLGFWATIPWIQAMPHW